MKDLLEIVIASTVLVIACVALSWACFDAPGFAETRKLLGLIYKRRPRPSCPRCKFTGHVANFCPQCGNMLKSHQAVKNWLYEQRTMLESRRCLEFEAEQAKP